MLKFLIFLAIGAQGVGAFLSQKQNQRSSGFCFDFDFSSSSPSTALSAAMTFDDMVTRVDHYEVRIPKPLGIIFGENREPYLGLKVDDVSEGMNGGKAGLKVGDQLLAINESVVVGKDFDSVMGMLQNEEKLELVMYRGPVGQLFTILANQLEEDESIFADEDEDEYGEESQAVIMDENYESPVRIEVKEQKPLTAGDFGKAFLKLGSMLGETLTSDPNEGNMSDDTAADASSPPQPKKKTGFFGLGGDSVQLDAEEARGYRQEKIEPDEY